MAVDETGQQASYPDPMRAWWAACVLSLLYALSYVDRQLLSLLVEPIQADLEISDTNMGLLGGFAFAVFYTIMGLPIARIADRASRRWVIVAGVAAWSVMTTACGLARSFPQLFLARVGVSVGEATLSPAAYSMLSDYFPPKRLGRAMSVYVLGAGLGLALAYALGGALFALFDSGGATLALPFVGALEPWQATFVAIGLPGALLGLLMLAVAEPPRTATAAATANAPTDDVIAFLKARAGLLAALFGGVAAFQIAAAGFTMWLPAHFGRAFGWRPDQIGAAFGAVVLVSSILGVIAAGMLGDRLKAGTGRAESYIRLMALWAGIGFIPFTFTSLMPSPVLALLLLAGGTFLLAGPTVLAPAVIQLVTPNAMRAQISALYLLVVSLLGMGLGPLLMGAMTDHVFADPAALRFSMAIVSALSLASSAVALAWAAGRAARITEPA